MTSTDWQIKIFTDDKENVKKYVFEKPDAIVESVLYKYPDYKTRTVICCSTMSGCPVGCRFCGTGDSFVRNLTAEEVISQPVKLLEDVEKETGVNANDIKKLQIMFMSMGEPLLNKNVIPAIRELHKRYPKAALLISTSGPDVDYEPWLQLAEEVPTVGLQFSVHESTDEARNKLIPFNRKLTLNQISMVGEQFFLRTQRPPFFNYCVHEKNNTEQDIARLCGLFNPKCWQATLSVICERGEHIAAANERQRTLAEDFAGKMLGHGYSVRVFNPAGQDSIGGGCGQLWYVQDWMKSNPDKARPSIGRGLPIIHTPGVSP